MCMQSRSKEIVVLIVLAVFAMSCEGVFGNRDEEVAAVADVHAAIGDAPIISWLKTVPRVGKDFVHFLWSPTEFTSTWVANPSTRPSPWIVLASSLTFVAVVYAVYRAIFRSTPLRRVFPDLPVESGKSTTKSPPLKPRIVGFGMKEIKVGRSLSGEVTSYSESWGLRFGARFPEALTKGTRTPQFMVLKLGIIQMVVADIIPESFTTKSTQTLFLIIFGFIAAISSFPCALFLGTTSTFADAFAFTIVASTYCLLFESLLILIAVLLVRDLFRIDIVKRFRSVKTIIVQFVVGRIVALLWITIAFFPIIRSVYASYKQLYSFDHWQMIVLVFGSAFFSAVVTPVIFIPFCYIWLRFRGVVEAMT